MKIFLDFDDTLLNSKRLVETLASYFEEMGIPLDSYYAAYERVRATLGEGERSYDFEKHLKELATEFEIDTEKTREGVQKILSTMPKFIFSDVVPFLEKCRKRNCLTYLVSFGSADFQGEKVKNSGLEKHFDFVSIGPWGKDEAIKKILDLYPPEKREALWFVDDKLTKIEEVKRVHPAIKTILMQREEGRYPGFQNEYCDYLVHDLGEAEEIIFS